MPDFEDTLYHYEHIPFYHRSNTSTAYATDAIAIGEQSVNEFVPPPEKYLEVSSFPLCCTAKVISNFGGTVTSGGHQKDLPIDQLRSELSEYITKYSKYGLAFLSVVLNDSQKDGLTLMEEFGFEGSGWMEKPNHPETKVQLFWKHLNK